MTDISIDSISNEFIPQEFLSQSIYRISLNLPRIEKCLEELNEEELWQRPNSSSNSIGNLILHMCGNTTQYILSALTGGQDDRNRDAEFAAKEGWTKEELSEKVSATINDAILVLEELEEERLRKIYSVQGYELSGIGIIIHVTEHISYHTGQITFWTKMLKDKDMGFYAGMDLNKKNQP